MTSGDFAVGLSTIITGLALTVILSSFHGLLVNRRRVKWDWVTIIAATMVFVLLMVGYVWACAISVALHVPLVFPSVVAAVAVVWLVHATVRERRRMRSRR